MGMGPVNGSSYSAYTGEKGEKGEKGGCGKKPEGKGEGGGGMSLEELLNMLPPEQREEFKKMISEGKDPMA